MTEKMKAATVITIAAFCSPQNDFHNIEEGLACKGNCEKYLTILEY